MWNAWSFTSVIPLSLHGVQERDMHTVAIPTCSRTPIQNNRCRHFRSILQWKKQL
jgi:hypothetical protein